MLGTGVSEWYYTKAGEKQDPITQEALLEMLRSGEISTKELVWKQGMEGWKEVSQVPLLAAAVLARKEAAPEDMAAPPSPREQSRPTGGASPYQSPTTQPYPATALQPGVPIQSYLWQSIVVTLLCCLPFGIVAIVYASRVNGLIARGDLPAAQAAADKAKLWSIISLVSGLVISGLSVIGNIAQSQ